MPICGNGTQRILLMFGLVLLETATATTFVRAAPKSIVVRLEPNECKGVGFGEELFDSTSLRVTLQSEPTKYKIADKPAPRARDSGSPLWLPIDSDLPATSYSFQAIGIRRDDDHGVKFTGELIPVQEGKQGKRPTFTTSVADIRLAAHEYTLSDGCGLTLPASMVKGAFPATLSGNTGFAITFDISPHWGGYTTEAVGNVVFTVNSSNGGAPGVALYYDDKSIPDSGILVSGAGLSKAVLKVLTNEDFKQSVTIRAEFKWGVGQAASEATAVTAVDYLNVTPLNDFAVCAVSFGDIAMAKASTNDPYASNSMTFSDNGASSVGWKLAGYASRWHWVSSPKRSPLSRDPITVPAYTDSLRLTPATPPGVSVLLYTKTQNPIPSLKLLGRDANGVETPMTFVSGGSNGSIAHFTSTECKSLLGSTISHDTIILKWYYGVGDSSTPNLSAGTTNHQVFRTLAPPVTERGVATAKRMDWASAISDRSKSIVEAAGNFTEVLAVNPGFSSSARYGRLPTPWEVLDSKLPGSCIALAVTACGGLNQVGIQAKERYSCPTADGSPGFPPVSEQTCRSEIAGTITYRKTRVNVRLVYRTGRDTRRLEEMTSGWNAYEGFFTVEDPAIKAFMIAPKKVIDPTDSKYYYLQVLRSLQEFYTVRQWWSSVGEQPLKDGEILHDKQPLLDLGPVEIPAIPAKK